MIDFTGVKALTIPEGSVKKITSNGVVLWEKITSRIPSEYQEVEWIGTTGTQFILFNTTHGNVNEMTLTVAYNEFVGSYMSGYEVNGAGFYMVRMSKSAQALDFYNGTPSAYKRSSKVALNTVYELYIKSDFGNSANTFAILQNGNTLWSGNGTISATTVTNSYFGIGALNIRPTDGLRGKIYAFQYKCDDIIVREFIPCYRKSDGVIGMYDIVSKTFFTNAGTGSFTKGADV